MFFMIGGRMNGYVLNDTTVTHLNGTTGSHFHPSTGGGVPCVYFFCRIKKAGTKEWLSIFFFYVGVQKVKLEGQTGSHPLCIILA